MKRRPTVMVLRLYPATGSVRLLLRGGDVAPDWEPRSGREAWCRVTVCFDADGTGWVAAFGGEVWPAAWPDLFKVGPRTKDGQATWLTEEGLRLVNEALAGVAR